MISGNDPSFFARLRRRAALLLIIFSSATIAVLRALLKTTNFLAVNFAKLLQSTTYNLLYLFLLPLKLTAWTSDQIFNPISNTIAHIIDNTALGLARIFDQPSLRMLGYLAHVAVGVLMIYFMPTIFFQPLSPIFGATQLGSLYAFITKTTGLLTLVLKAYENIATLRERTKYEVWLANSANKFYQGQPLVRGNMRTSLTKVAFYLFLVPAMVIDIPLRFALSQLAGIPLISSAEDQRSFLEKSGDQISLAWQNIKYWLYSRIYINEFDNIFAQSLANKDMEPIFTYLQKPRFYTTQTRRVIDWSDDLRWQLQYSRYREFQNKTPEEIAQLSQQYPEFSSYISKKLMQVPVYLRKSMGARTSVDLFEILDYTLTNGAINPETKEQIKKVYYDARMFKHIAQVLEQPISANGNRVVYENPFDNALEIAIACKDIGLLWDYLENNGAHIVPYSVGLAPTQFHLVLNHDLQFDIYRSKYNAYTSENFWENRLGLSSSELASVTHDEPYLTCPITYQLLRVPVYIEFSQPTNARHTYMDLCSLLQAMQMRAANPITQEAMQSIRAIKMDANDVANLPKIIKFVGLMTRANPVLDLLALLKEQQCRATDVVTYQRITGVTERRVRIRKFPFTWHEALSKLCILRGRNQDGLWPTAMQTAEIKLCEKMHPDLLCAITRGMMRDPVYILVNGERKYFDLLPLLQWLNNNAEIPDTRNLNGEKMYLESMEQIVYDPEKKDVIMRTIKIAGCRRELLTQLQSQKPRTLADVATEIEAINHEAAPVSDPTSRNTLAML